MSGCFLRICSIATSSELKVVDRWYFKIRVYDGKDYSDEVSSKEVKIAKAPTRIVLTF